MARIAFCPNDREVLVSLVVTRTSRLPIDIADPRALIKVSRTSKSTGATAAAKRATATELVTAAAPYGSRLN